MEFGETDILTPKTISSSSFSVKISIRIRKKGKRIVWNPIGLGSAFFVAQAANRAGGDAQSARQFVGYWMGVDPLDGGDVRRGIMANDDGTFSMIGHDSVLTLCDGTDRGIIRVSDFTAVRSALVSDHHILTCTNTGITVTLRNHTELIDKNIIRETVTTQAGALVDVTLYHRVSQQ